MGQYDIPRFLEGGLTAQVCAIYLRDNDLERALQRGLEMTWWLHKEAEDNSLFEVVTTVEDLRRVKAEGKCGGILSFEGFEPLGFELRYLDLWYKLGLRMASLTHSRRNFFGDGTQRGVQTGGLTDAGKQAVKRMNQLGIVVDLGHLNQVGIWEVIELSTQPVVFSHTAPRRYFAADGGGKISRELGVDLSRGRERLEAIARTGGVVGVIFYGQPTLDDVVADIEYLLDIIGPDHAGLGSDYYGMERTPLGIEDMSKLPALTRRLVERGHSDETILKILGENYLRVFEHVWKK
jgi:membrane dipeptidase